ncbi:MAG TPA: hypothetical protein PLL77_09430 [Pyrinomonadaceae bacterium]|nr:hypothetical protein [Pyrinomonadaceae bacterium]
MRITTLAGALCLMIILLTPALGQRFAADDQDEDWKKNGKADACHSDITVAVHLDSINTYVGPSKDGYLIWYNVRNTKPNSKVKFSYVLAADEAEARKKVMDGSIQTSTLESGPAYSWLHVKNPTGAYFVAGYVTTEPSTTGQYEGCNSAANSVDLFCTWNPTEKCPNFDKVKAAQTSLKNDPQALMVPTAFLGNGDAYCSSEDPGVERPKDPANEIRTKILEILRANTQPISLEEFRGAIYTVTKVDFVNEGGTLVFRFTERWDSIDGFKAAKPEDVSWWQQDLSTTISFEEMAATLKPLALTSTENKYPYVQTTNVRWLEMGGKRDSQNYKAFELEKAYKIFGPRSPHHAIPFDMGPADANYKELAKLLGQLRAMSASQKPSSSITPCIPAPKAANETSKFAAVRAASVTASATPTPVPQPEGFVSTVKGDEGIGRAQQENDRKRVSDAASCTAGLAELDQEVNGINARKPSGISTIPVLQTAMYAVAKYMQHLQTTCQAQPQYSQYAEYKATYDSLMANCNAIATTPSVCVAKLNW